MISPVEDERPPFAWHAVTPGMGGNHSTSAIRNSCLGLSLQIAGGFDLRLRWLIMLAEILAIAAFPLANAGAEGRSLHQTQHERSSLSKHVPVAISIDRVGNVDAPLLPSSSLSHDRDSAPDCCGSMCQVMVVPAKIALVRPRSSDNLRVPVDAKQVTEGLKECLERPPRRRQQHPPLAPSVRNPI
jgi:hypothetical protein